MNNSSPNGRDDSGISDGSELEFLNLVMPEPSFRLH
jgi:hypothetical protein